MTFKDGDFLEIEYTLWDAGTGTVISSTDEKKAKDGNVHDPKMKYGPVLIIVGAPGVIKGLDRELRNMNSGEQKKFTFKPTEAFGERSEDLVRVMPMADFRARDINPYPGMQVNLDDVTAVVKSVNSGRVVVDANHPYAGKDITYEVKVVRQLTAEKDKVDAIGNSYGIKPSTINVASDALDISFNGQVNKNADYFIGKANLIASVFTHFKNVKKVDVKEEYTRSEEAKSEK